MPSDAGNDVEVSQLSEDTAGHYEAVLNILEGYKEECVDLKARAANQSRSMHLLEEENRALREQAAVLQEEVQARNDVVDKLHTMITQMPASVDAAEHTELARKAQYFEEQCSETSKLMKPLQSKLHQQEKYISRIEAQLAAHNTAARQTHETMSHMTGELTTARHRHTTEVKHHKQYTRKLLTTIECLRMEREDTAQSFLSHNSKTEQVKAEFIHHAESVVRLKEEQIRLLRSDVEMKDGQLLESKNIITDMMGNLTGTMDQVNTLRGEKEAVRTKLNEATARVAELENIGETAKDTRKQVRREVQGVLAQAKETEQQWRKEKLKYEEVVSKQRGKIQSLAAQKNKLDEQVADQKASAKKAVERSQGLVSAIERAFTQVCSSYHVEQLEMSTPKTEQLNSRQKLQQVIETATEAMVQALKYRSSSTSATQQLEEMKEHCKAVESHAGWLESEWGVCKERKEKVEEEGRKVRDDCFSASKQNRELVAENESLKDQLSKLENAVAVQSDKLSEHKGTFDAEVHTLTAKLAAAQTSCEQHEEQLRVVLNECEEMPLLRERIHELTAEQDSLSGECSKLMKEKEQQAREKEQVYEAKIKHQKNTTRYLAELKKLRSDLAEQKKKQETASKVSEQLRRQVQLKDNETKTTSDRVASLQGTLDKKEKELRREEVRREQACRDSEQTRHQAQELVKELEALQRKVKEVDVRKADGVLEVLKKENMQLRQETDDMRAMLREEVERRAVAEEDLQELLKKPPKQAALQTPTRKVTNAGDHAHYVRQQQCHANTASGIDTPYAVRYRNFLERSPAKASTPKRSPSVSLTPQRSSSPSSPSPTRSPYKATPQPSTEPRRTHNRFKCDIPTPPKFDAGKHLEDCSSVAVIDAYL